MKIKFTNFWPSFDPKESFFYEALSNSAEGVEVVSGRSEVDLEIVSVFEPKIKTLKNKVFKFIASNSGLQSDSALVNTSSSIPKRCSERRIWYTGENIRVPFGQDFDHSFSYEQDSYKGSNTYFPLWYSDLNFFTDSKFSKRAGLTVTESRLLTPRILDRKNRKLACAFVGNSHPMRARVLNELAKWGEVDVYGTAVGKPVKYKSEIAKDYKFMVCLENDLFPGYVTEKFLEAHLSGCVPLYWGDLGADQDINRNCLVNLADFSSIEEGIDYVLSVAEPRIYGELFEQPLLHKLPEVDTILSKLRSH